MTAALASALRIVGSPMAASRIVRVRFGRLLLGIFLLVAWHAGAIFLGPNLLAPPGAVFARIGRMALSRDFYGHLLVTTTEALGA